MRTEDALYRRFTSDTPHGALSGISRAVSRALAPATIMRSLENRHGSARAAAAAAGVPISTWNHVKAGRRAPSETTVHRLRAATRPVLIGTNANAYRTWPGVVILAQFTMSEDHETRAFNIGAWVDGMGRRRLDAVQADVVDAWLAGEDGIAARALERVVEQGFHGQMAAGTFPFHMDLLDVRYFPTQAEAERWKQQQGVVHHG